jgi:hypothetical protein
MGQCIAVAANMSKTFFWAFDQGVLRMSAAKANKKPYTWQSKDILRHLPGGPNVAVCKVEPTAAAAMEHCHSNFGSFEDGSIAAGEPGLVSKKL